MVCSPQPVRYYVRRALQCVTVFETPMVRDRYTEFRTLPPAVINLINQLVEPIIVPLAQSCACPRLTMRPEANCKRYETLYTPQEVTV